TFLKKREQLFRSAAQKLFKLFGQLTRHYNGSSRKNFVQFVEQLLDSIRRFVKRQCSGKRLQPFQLFTPLTRLVREKPNEMEFVCRQTAGRQRRDQRARAGNRLDAQTGI